MRSVTQVTRKIISEIPDEYNSMKEEFENFEKFEHFEKVRKFENFENSFKKV